MSETQQLPKHTPSPWTVGESDDVFCGHTGDMHYVVMAPGKERGEIEANARLIAAAPDLLAAAKIVFAELNARIDAAIAAGGTSVPVFNGIVDLHDAIAKAERAQ